MVHVVSPVVQYVSTYRALLLCLCARVHVSSRFQPTYSTCLQIADRLPSLLAFYHRSLHHHIHLVQILEDDNLPFERAREAIQQWAAQRGPGMEDLDGGWDSGEWEEICRIEVGRWDGNE